MGVTAWVVIQFISSIGWGGPHATRDGLVFQSREEMAQVWAADGGRLDLLPPVDFEKETVVAVFGGERPTSGYSIRIDSVRQARQAYNSSELGEGTVAVLFRETAPAEGQAVVNARTYPSHVIVIPKTYGPVVFVPSNSAHGMAIRLFDERMEEAIKNLENVEEVKSGIFELRPY